MGHEWADSRSRYSRAGDIVGFVVMIIFLAAIFLFMGWHGNEVDRMVDEFQNGSLFDSENCTEDMPCWDCETMGNRQCGPTKP